MGNTETRISCELHICSRIPTLPISILVPISLAVSRHFVRTSNKLSTFARPPPSPTVFPHRPTSDQNEISGETSCEVTPAAVLNKSALACSHFISGGPYSLSSSSAVSQRSENLLDLVVRWLDGGSWLQAPSEARQPVVGFAAGVGPYHISTNCRWAAEAWP